jgi:hypothetical protein
MGALLRWGQPGDVRIDAHLKHGKRQWCYLVEVNVPKLLKRADVLVSARPEAPDGLQDRQCVSKQLDVRLKVRIHYVLDEFVAEIVAVGVDVVQPVGLVSVTLASDSQAKREVTLPMRGWERWVRTSGSKSSSDHRQRVVSGSDATSRLLADIHRHVAAV